MSETNDALPAQSPTTAAPKRPSLTTEYLANERTFLAWIRTSLAMTGLGFAVAKFGTWLRELSGQPTAVAEASRSGRSTITGIVMIATGGLFAILAAWRHWVVTRQIESGTVRPAKNLILTVTIIVLILGAAVSYLVLSEHRSR